MNNNYITFLYQSITIYLFLFQFNMAYNQTQNNYFNKLPLGKYTLIEHNINVLTSLFMICYVLFRYSDTKIDTNILVSLLSIEFILMKTYVIKCIINREFRENEFILWGYVRILSRRIIPAFILLSIYYIEEIEILFSCLIEIGLFYMINFIISIYSGNIFKEALILIIYFCLSVYFVRILKNIKLQIKYVINNK